MVHALHSELNEWLKSRGEAQIPQIYDL